MGKWSDLARELEGEAVASPAVQKVQKAPKASGINPDGVNAGPNCTKGSIGEPGEDKPDDLPRSEVSPLSRRDHLGVVTVAGNAAPAASQAQWWRERIIGMADIPPPPAVPARWWGALQETSLHFLDEWGEKAEALGWTSVDLFAVNGKAPYARIDQYGLCPALAGDFRRVAVLTAAEAVIRSGQREATYRRLGWEQPGAVLVWTLGK